MSHDGHAVWLDTGYILKGEMKGKKSWMEAEAENLDFIQKVYVTPLKHVKKRIK
jgi:hypothetical protein